MDNLQIWFYVIVGIIYVISRAFKKKPEEAAPPRPSHQNRPNQPAGRSAQGGKTMTFDELLREIAESKKPASAPSSTPRTSAYNKPSVTRPTSTAKPTYVDYDDDLQDEEQDLEDVNYNYRKDKTYEAYNTGKKSAFNRPSYDDAYEDAPKLGELTESVLKFGRFEEFGRKKKKLASKYAKELTQPGGFKKALVLSEILNRKY